MEESKLDAQYWENRYENQQTGWDIGTISPPLKAYIDQLTDKNKRILIPGCGYGHEGLYLHHQGFTQVYLLDFAQKPLQEFSKRNPSFPTAHLLCTDFFSVQLKFELILEQTLFCAIDPQRREEYIRHSYSLLSDHGKLVGVLFDREFEGGPPFGGNSSTYQQQFSAQFQEVKIEPCYNSLPARQGSEVFLIAQKKKI